MSTLSPTSDNSSANFYHKDMARLEDQIQSEAKKNRELTQEQMKKLEDRYIEALHKKSEETDQAVDYIRDSAHEKSTEQRENHQAELENLKRQVYNNKGQLTREQIVEGHKKELQKLYDEGEIRHQTDLQKVDAKIQEDGKNLEKIEQKNQKKIENLTQNHSEETALLHDRMRTLSNYTDAMNEKKGGNDQKWIHENEAANRAHNRQIADGYERSMDRLQKELNEKDSRYTARTSDTVQATEDRYSNLLRKQGTENYENTKNLQIGFRNRTEELEKSRKRDESKKDEALSRAVQVLNQDRLRSLTAQGKEYQNSAERANHQNHQEVEALQKALSAQKSSPDTSNISPAAEAKMRKSVSSEYEKNFNTEVERNQLAREEMNRNNSQKINEIVNSHDDREMTLQQRNSQERSFERAQYFESLGDTTHHAETKAKQQDQGFERERLNLYRQFSNALEHQRRQFDHNFEVSRGESEAKLFNTRQEADFNLKLQLKTLNARQNEISREYEKRLVDQKTDYENQIDDIKNESRLALKDLERHEKQALEVQSKGYEQRIAQQQAQTKEREHLLAENYQNELDRTKRSYEIISKKKS